MATQYQSYNETLVSQGGNAAIAVTQAQIAAGPVVIKAAPGRLCQILITTTLTAAQSVTVFDNASTGSGTIIGVTTPGATASTLFTFYMPAVNGITIGQNAALAAGAITVSFL